MELIHGSPGSRQSGVINCGSGPPFHARRGQDDVSSKQSPSNDVIVNKLSVICTVSCQAITCLFVYLDCVVSSHPKRFIYVGCSVSSPPKRFFLSELSGVKPS